MSDSRYVKVQGGREHELFASLLDRAHKAGLRSIESSLHTVPTKENGETAIVHVRVTMESGQIFEAWGDASPKNTKIRPVAMAETRGKGRCLRDALNIGSNEFEDLGGTEPLQRPTEAVREQPRASGGSTANDSEAPLTDAEVDDGVVYLESSHQGLSVLLEEIHDLTAELTDMNEDTTNWLSSLVGQDAYTLEGIASELRQRKFKRDHEEMKGAAKK